jgi:hypothetical protein
MIYTILADLVVAVHVGYVGFVVFGLVLIVAGWLLGWNWVRNPWFRLIHLAAIIIVALETAVGMTCPLTTLEYYLQDLAGDEIVQGDFINRMVRGLIFTGLPEGHWLLTALYYGFAALVLATLFLVPPRWRRKAKPEVNRPDYALTNR